MELPLCPPEALSLSPTVVLLRGPFRFRLWAVPVVGKSAKHLKVVLSNWTSSLYVLLLIGFKKR
jgi:hypothetical protein